MKTLHLKDLITPISIDDFLTSHWPHKPLFIPAQAAKIENLLSLPQLQSLENLIAARTSKIRACLPDFDDS